MTSSSTSIQSGQSISFNVQVTPNQPGGPALTGSVQFSSNGVNIGNPVALSGGQATFSKTALPSGLDNVTAGYSGDMNYAGSAAVVSITVQSGPPTFTVSANPTTIQVNSPGQSGATVLTITALNGFSSNGNASIILKCTGLSAETSCSLTIFNLPTNGTVTTALYFLTTAPSSALPSARNRRMHNGGRAEPSKVAFVFFCASASQHLRCVERGAAGVSWYRFWRLDSFSPMLDAEAPEVLVAETQGRPPGVTPAFRSR